VYSIIVSTLLYFRPKNSKKEGYGCKNMLGKFMLSPILDHFVSKHRKVYIVNIYTVSKIDS
jgi:hypothetical protein